MSVQPHVDFHIFILKQNDANKNANVYEFPYTDFLSTYSNFYITYLNLRLYLLTTQILTSLHSFFLVRFQQDLKWTTKKNYFL